MYCNRNCTGLLIFLQSLNKFSEQKVPEWKLDKRLRDGLCPVQLDVYFCFGTALKCGLYRGTLEAEKTQKWISGGEQVENPEETEYHMKR